MMTLSYNELEALYGRAKDLKKQYCTIQKIVHKNLYPDGHVFDEEKSVKWNREEKERKNKETLDELERLNTECDNCWQKYYEELNNFLINDPEYGNGKITEDDLRAIERFMSDWNSDVAYLSEGWGMLMSFYKDCIKLIIRKIV